MNTLLKTGIGSTLATLTVAALSASANATTITFDPINGLITGLPLNTPFVEGDFTYRAIDNTGGDFSEALGFGNPAPALTTIGAGNGDTIAIEFFRTGGGLFTFDSFDSRFGGPSGTSDAWAFFGEVGGSAVGFFSFATSSASWTPATSSITTPIDRLVIQFASTNAQGPLAVDNLVLTPTAATPEPSTLLGLGLLGVGALVSRKRKA